MNIRNRSDQSFFWKPTTLSACSIITLHQFRRKPVRSRKPKPHRLEMPTIDLVPAHLDANSQTKLSKNTFSELSVCTDAESEDKSRWDIFGKDVSLRATRAKNKRRCDCLYAFDNSWQRTCPAFMLCQRMFSVKFMVRKNACIVFGS